MTKKITTELFTPSSNTKNIVSKTENKSLSLFDQLLKEAKKDIGVIANTKKDIVNVKIIKNNGNTNTNADANVSLKNKQINILKMISKNDMPQLEKKLDNNEVLSKTNEKKEKLIKNPKSEDVKNLTKLDNKTKMPKQKANYSLDKLIIQSKIENSKNLNTQNTSTNDLQKIKIIKNVDLLDNKIIKTNTLNNMTNNTTPKSKKQEDVRKATSSIETKIINNKEELSLENISKNKKASIGKIKNTILPKSNILETNVSNKDTPKLNKQEEVKKATSTIDTKTITTKQELALENISNKKLTTKQTGLSVEVIKKDTSSSTNKIVPKQTNKLEKVNQDIVNIKNNDKNTKELSKVAIKNLAISGKKDKPVDIKKEIGLIKKTNIEIKPENIKQKNNVLNKDNPILVKKAIDATLLNKANKQMPIINKDIKAEQTNEENTSKNIIIKSDIISEENTSKTIINKNDTISTNKLENIQMIKVNTKLGKKETNNSVTEVLNQNTTKNHQEEKYQTKQIVDDNIKQEHKDTKITKKVISLLNEIEKEDIGINKININKKDVLGKIYLGTQNNFINNQVLQNKNIKDKLVKNITSKSDIKESAKIMNLNMQDMKVDIKTYEHKQNLQKNLLNKIVLNQTILKKQTQENINSTNENIKITNNKNNSTDSEKVINLNISPSLALSIQSKIIGAKQGVSSMMSELAKKMYVNYKAPLTSFRINIFPSQMGSIAIIMKNDKENGISISMNMSNTNTLDALIENQQSLKDSLNKTFNNNTSFSLDFNMNKENSSNTSDNKNKKEEKTLSNEVLNSENIIDDKLDNLNYM